MMFESMFGNESSQLLEARKAAYARYQQSELPPSTDERWRRSLPEDFDPEKFSPYFNELAPQKSRDDASLPELVLKECHVLVLTPGTVKSLGIPLEESKGLELNTTISSPTMISDFFSREDLFLGKRFGEYHKALSQSLIQISIKKDTKIKHPLLLLHRRGEGSPLLTSVILNLEEGAEAKVIEDFEAQPESGQLLTLINCGANSRMQYLTNLSGSAKGDYLQHVDAELGENARLDCFSMLTGGSKTRALFTTKLQGRNARSYLKGLVVARGRQHFDVDPVQIHEHGSSYSDMLFKAVLTERSRVIFQGDIRIDRGAPGCEAYQVNKNLLLSKNARVDTLPKLHILPDDVKCKHGAATGNIDLNQLYYLTCRGFSKEVAIKLILTGFLEEILGNFEDGALKDYFEGNLANAAIRLAEQVEI